MKENYATKSFAERYDIEARDYVDIPVGSLSFSRRIINRLMTAGITTSADLLNCTPKELMKLKGFGENCLKEVELFCEEKRDKNPDSFHKYNKIQIMPSKEIVPYRKKILAGDFSFVDTDDLNDDEIAFFQRYKDAYECIGSELILDCINSQEKVLPLIEMLNDFEKCNRNYFEIKRILQKIPFDRQRKTAKNYIKAFTLNENQRLLLYQMCPSEECSIFEMVKTDLINNDNMFALLKQFLKWCSFDLQTEIAGIFTDLYVNDRSRIVLQMRASKQTLEQIGLELGVTRERVRQIEAKIKRRFVIKQNQVRILEKIFAERDGDTILTFEEVGKYAGPYAKELVYMLQSDKLANCTYDRHYEVFIVEDNTLVNRVHNCLELFPEYIKVEEIESILNDASVSEEIPIEMLEKAFLDIYRRTGEVYHRYRLSLTAIYEKVLETYYPNGIKAYDAEELCRFRKIVADEYGDVGLPKNDHALTTRITSFCILCGRGMYQIKKNDYLPKKLANEIHKYIVDNENTIFLTNTIFSVFKNDLIAVGIDNKYFLQGVLRELFEDEFTFRRDYISKDANVTSLYSSVVDFIKKSPYPVTKAQIQESFPGITEIVISFSVSDPSIINYFGEYLHGTNLNVSTKEKEYLYNVLETLLCDGHSHHIKEMYDIVLKENSQIFTRNAAINAYAAFGVLEYLFRNEFQFERPYISKNGVEIIRTEEMLHDLIYGSNEITVSEISEFARKNHFQIQSLLEYVNDCNDQYLLVGNDKMMKIELTGIDAEIATQVDEIVSNEITQTIPIKNLSVWTILPQISVPWTEWLIYSVLNKWGHKTFVATSSNQFRLSVPLVAPIDNYDPSAFKDMDKGDTEASFVVDDLNNLDSLLEEIMKDGFLTEL